MTTEDAGVARLQQRLGYTFADPALLRQALTHRSHANENPDDTGGHNERLEFLGDTVLDFVVSDELMARHPDRPEGELSKFRASLVSEPALAEIARDLSLGEALRMGRGEELSGGRHKDSLLSDALEALLAAVYLDSRHRDGMAAVRRTVLALFAGRLDQPSRVPSLRDFKTALQEAVHRRYKDTVSYGIVRESGADHEKVFEVAVRFRGSELGRGTGRSKKQAEQAAARVALQQLESAP